MTSAYVVETSVANKSSFQIYPHPDRITQDDLLYKFVVQRVDNTVQRINLFPADSVACFVNTYHLVSDLSIDSIHIHATL